jgi:signal transduction histidine kinase
LKEGKNLTLHSKELEIETVSLTNKKEKIFAKFYRAKNAREKLSGGSGIGLYMCEQYVKAHKGTINFESKVNEGTTFYIKLPLKSVVDVNDFLTKL